MERDVLSVAGRLTDSSGASVSMDMVLCQCGEYRLVTDES